MILLGFRGMSGLDRVTLGDEKEIPTKVEFEEFEGKRKRAMK